MLKGKIQEVWKCDSGNPGYFRFFLLNDKNEWFEATVYGLVPAQLPPKAVSINDEFPAILGEAEITGAKSDNRSDMALFLATGHVLLLYQTVVNDQPGNDFKLQSPEEVREWEDKYRAMAPIVVGADNTPQVMAAPKKKRGRGLRFVSLRGLVRLAFLLGLFALIGWFAHSYMCDMPGESFRGPLPEIKDRAHAALVDALRKDVEALAGGIGRRDVYEIETLDKAADWVERRLKQQTALPVKRLTYEARAKKVHNFEVELRGGEDAEEIVVVGAHYDSMMACPAANDNASGVAGLLAIAKALAKEKPSRTLRFVAFTCEEPPLFQTDEMGSRVYAKMCRERNDNIVAMLSLETIGFYTDKPDSQGYPPPFSLLYPSTGDFIAFVGNLTSADLVRRSIYSFRSNAQFPSEGAALPEWLTGVGWSDHWSFWQENYPAAMVTDTAPFRYEHYHKDTDTPDKLDYDRMARVVSGLEKVIRDLSRIKED